MIPTGGTTVRYQGVVCLPDFEFALEASLRPTSGYVRMSLADLGIQSVDQLRIDPGATGLDTQHLRSREAGDEFSPRSGISRSSKPRQTAGSESRQPTR